MFSRTAHWIRRILHRDKLEQELSEEIQTYFDIQIERRIAQGVSADEARRMARLDYGGADHVKERVREVRMGAGFETVLQDVRYALRGLKKNPGFALAAILSLGLGLGANTAIFTLVDTVLLKSLPVKNPDRLFFIDDTGGKSQGNNAPPYPCYEILRDNSRYLSGMAAFSGDRFKVTIDGAQELVTGQSASGSYFDVVGVGAALGRVMTPADDTELGRGGLHGAVAVISDSFWERRFARSPEVLGKSILVGTNAVTIVGVTPPGFFGLTVGAPIDITVPMMLSGNVLRNRQTWWLSVVGRLKDDASQEQARADLDRYFKAYMQGEGMSNDKYFSGIALVPAASGLTDLRRRFSRPLLIVMTIVALVLLIGCANVANLLLARAGARRNEIAMRLAIGASRARLIRQLLTEGLLLVTIAAGAGILLAKLGVSLLVTLFAGTRMRIVLEPQFDWRVIAFTALTAILTGLLFSIAPALHTARTDAAKPGSAGRTGMDRFHFRAGNVLVMVQIMLSVVLLCGAALFLRSLRNLTTLNAGFQRDGVLVMRVDATLPRPSEPLEGKAREEDHARIGRMWEDFLEPLTSLPQIKAVTASTLSPLSGRDRGVRMDISGEAGPPPQNQRGIQLNQVSAGFFDTFGLTPIAGRVFTPRDQANSLKVAVLNETAVRTRFGGSNPVGRRVSFMQRGVEYEIIGVVRDVRYQSLRKPAGPLIYLPIQQAVDPLQGVMLSVRTTGNAAAILPAVRQSMQRTIPGGFIAGTATMEQLVDESLIEERLLSILATLFGVLALVLAAIGLYGIMSFTVIQRTREIGIRIAIGAQRNTVLWMVMRNVLGLVCAGLALGVPLVFFAKEYIKSQLFGLEALDPTAISAATFLLLAVASLAGAWPAWRASRVDPTISLRYE